MCTCGTSQTYEIKFDGSKSAKISHNGTQDQTKLNQKIIIPRGEYRIKLRARANGIKNGQFGATLLCTDRYDLRKLWKILPEEERVEIAKIEQDHDWKTFEAIFTSKMIHEVELVIHGKGIGTVLFDSPSLERIPGKLEPPKIPSLNVHHSPPKAKATGFIHIEEINGVSWLVDADGNLFWDVGLCKVIYEADSKELVKSFPDRNEWAKKTIKDVKSWGFSSLAAWFGPEVLEPTRKEGLRFNVFITTKHKENKYCLEGPEGAQIPGNWKWPDPFNPTWRSETRRRAKQIAEPLKNDRNLIAYHIDNELAHWPTMIPFFYSEGCGKEFSRWLSERFKGDIANLNTKWSTDKRKFSFKSFEDVIKQKPDPRTSEVPPWTPAPKNSPDPMYRDFEDFEMHLVREYVEFCYNAVKEVDPNHMIFSHRFSCFSDKPLGRWSWQPMELFGKYDAISLNLYPWHGPFIIEDELDSIRALHQRTRRPIIITEWNLAVRDPSRNFTWGWQWIVRDQEERGQGYKNCISQLVNLPYVIGAHWFRLFDRLDVEDYIGGILTASGEPYKPLLKKMIETNQIILAVPQR